MQKYNYSNYEVVKSSAIKRIYFKLVILLFFISSLIQVIAQPLAEGKSKFLGNAIDNIFHPNYLKYWNQVTAGNAGKWGNVESSQDQYNWTQLDNIYNYSQQNNLLYKHHTLIWGNQQPGWINALDSVEQRAEIEEWISLVGERYPEMDMVDVVNEPLHAPPAYAQALGGNGETGWDWIITSFELARQYCPAQAKLILNEYNILQSNLETDKYLEIINLLKERGLIDAIGIQGHYFEFKGDGYTYSIDVIKNNLDHLADAGLPIYITEFDIDEADDQVQLENYQTYFPIFWEHPAVKGMTLWGYVEGDMWQADGYLVLAADLRYAERPAMKWLQTYIKIPFTPIPISPDRIEDVPLDPILMWHRSENAETYNVQLSKSREFSSIEFDATVEDTTVQLDSLDADEVYYWRVAASNGDGTSEFSDYAYFITEVLVGVEDKKEIPYKFALYQNYPNPFNPTTNIEYSVPRISNVSLKIYDALGREIKTLVDDVKSPGKYVVTFDAQSLSSGIYFCHLEAGSFNETKRLMLIK